MNDKPPIGWFPSWFKGQGNPHVTEEAKKGWWVVKLRCPSCQMLLRAKRKHLGRMVECPGCKTVWGLREEDGFRLWKRPEREEELMRFLMGRSRN
jgi:phage FluMu protein Com